MVEVAKVFADLSVLFFNLAWLVFLTQKHFGKVTTTAGHIFELNVLFNNTMNIFLWILLVDSGLQDYWCTLSRTVLTISSLSSLVAIAGAQIETAIFLKTLNVNTMMTNTAAKTILVLSIFAAGMGILTSLMAPPSARTVCQLETFCKTIMKNEHQMTIRPASVVFVVVFAVMGFTVFRSHQFKKKRQISCHQNRGKMKKTAWRNEDDLNNESAQGQGRLFTIQEAVSNFERKSEENSETPSVNVEDDIVIEDIETLPSLDQVSNGNTLTKNQLNTCLPGIDLMTQTLNKYFKNSLMSLLLLSYLLPWNLTMLYGRITDTGCENPTFRLMIEINGYYYLLMFNIFLPFLIKLKLDRLSN